MALLSSIWRRATATAIGPVAFFMKPFDDEKLIAAVRDALHRV